MLVAEVMVTPVVEATIEKLIAVAGGELSKDAVQNGMSA